MQLDTGRERLSRIIQRAGAVGLVLFVAALGVYLRTLAPGITWKNNGGDSGDLVTAAFTGGVPHPPGYPLYTALAQAFVLIPFGGVAFRVNLLSALAGAATVVVLFAVLNIVLNLPRGWKYGVAASFALVFGFSPLFWSQTTIAEVYALNALLTTLVLLGFVVWANAPNLPGDHFSPPRWGPWIVTLALGLGLAHHLTIVFMVPGGLLLLWRRTSVRKTLAVLGMALAIAVLFYMTLMLRAWRDPAINWGDPSTLPNLWAVVSGQLYRGYVFGLPWVAYPLRVAAWARLLFDQFTVFGVALGVWGGLRLFERAPRIAIALGLPFFFYSIFAISYRSLDSDVYLIPAFMTFAIGAAEGFSQVVGALLHQSHRSRWVRSTYPLVLCIGLVTFPLANLVRNFGAMDLSRDTEAIDFARQAFAVMPDNAVIVSSDTGEHIFSLWYCRYVERPQSHVLVVVPGLLAYPWYYEELERHNPDWVWPKPVQSDSYRFLQDFIANNKDRHAVFWAEPDPVIEKTFPFLVTGPIYQLSLPTSPLP